MVLDIEPQVPYNHVPWFVGQAGIDAYLNPNIYVVLDFETNNKDFGSAVTPENHIVLACWEVVYSDGRIEKKHKWGDEYEMAELEQDIRRADFVVAHNAKFELQWLKRCGIDLHEVFVYDTFLAEWVIAGNRAGRPGWMLNLDDTAKRYGLGAKLSLAAQCIGLGMDPSDIPREWLLPYCYKDVELSRRIYQRQMEILKRDDLLHLVLTRNLCCAVLADIEFNGGELDKERVYEEYEKSIAEFKELEAQLNAMTGGINLSSPKQLGTYLFETLKFPIPKDHKGNPIITKNGNFSTNVKVLEKLKATTDEQVAFFKLYKKRNRIDSLLTKNLEFFKLVCDHNGGRFHGQIGQGGTQTHRLNSTGRPTMFPGQKRPRGAQFQNMPRAYKRLFTALEKGYKTGEVDGAQLEFRVAADMGHDKVAYDVIVNGGDVHADTAKVFVDWNKSHPTEQHEDFIGLDYKAGRQPAKPQTFKPLYGGKGSHPAEKEYCKFFTKKYKGIADTQHEWCLEVLDRGFQINPYGMRFYWPGTKMSRTGYIDNTTQINNFSVQGFATAEIIPIALVYFWHRTRGTSIVIWNTIHDSIACRFKEEDEELFKLCGKVCLTTDVYDYLRTIYKYEFTVPLGAGVKVGSHWGEAPFEEIWDVFPDGREVYKKKD